MTVVLLNEIVCFQFTSEDECAFTYRNFFITFPCFASCALSEHADANIFRGFFFMTSIDTSIDY